MHPDITYVAVRVAGDGEAGPKTYLLAKDRLGHYARELGDEPEVLAEYTGADLVGLAYEPPFDFFTGRDNAHQVIAADYVTTESGTGIVHMAPAFGEEDMEYCQRNGIELVQPLDPGGKFTAMVPPYEGLQVFDANPVIIKISRPPASCCGTRPSSTRTRTRGGPGSR